MHVLALSFEKLRGVGLKDHSAIPYMPAEPSADRRPLQVPWLLATFPKVKLGRER